MALYELRTYTLYVGKMPRLSSFTKGSAFRP